MQAKKGISDVIATVLILMLTIVTVVIIAGVIVPFVREGITESTRCVPLREALAFDAEQPYNCYADGLNGVSVKAKFDESISISGFSLVFAKTGASESVKVESNSPAGQIRMLNSSLTTLSVPGPGELSTYVYRSNTNFDTVEIFPMLPDGKICDATDKIRLQACGEISLTIT